MTPLTEQTDPGERRVGERAKVATAWVFVLAGAAFATWASRIPDVRDSLGLAPGQLGLLLLVGSCGSLVGLPLAGWVASRIGTRRTVLLGASLAMVGLTGAGSAPVRWTASGSPRRACSSRSRASASGTWR